MIIILSQKNWRKSLKKKFTCLGENTEKYISFAVLIEKEITRIDKNGEVINNMF